MKKWFMTGITVIASVLIVSSVALAGKEEVEKKAKDTLITLSVQDLRADDALKMISKLGGVAIKTAAPLKEAPTVTLNLKDVSVFEAVKYVTSLVNLKCAVVDDGIEVSAK